MRHIKKMSRVPGRAETGLCTAIDNDFQAQLCFMYQVMTSFFLPVLQLKQPEDPTDTNETAT